MNPITVIPVSAFIFLYRLEWLIAIVLAIWAIFSSGSSICSSIWLTNLERKILSCDVRIISCGLIIASLLICSLILFLFCNKLLTLVNRIRSLNGLVRYSSAPVSNPSIIELTKVLAVNRIIGI